LKLHMLFQGSIENDFLEVCQYHFLSSARRARLRWIWSRDSRAEACERMKSWQRLWN